MTEYEKPRILSVTAQHVAELERENAKLRELCAEALEWLRWAGGITCPPEVPDEFADELRELVRELYEDQCDECDRWKYRDRVRELGIEVDG